MESIDELIKQSQSECLAFMTSIEKPLELAKLIVSFSNNKGGVILIGVNSKEKPVGVAPKKEQDLIQSAYHFIERDIQLEISIHTIKHYFVLKVVIERQSTPMSVIEYDASATYYYRLGDKSIQANKIITNYLNLKKYKKEVLISEVHQELLMSLSDGGKNLSNLYKTTNSKPKIVDRALAELIKVGRVQVKFENDSFLYSIS